MLTFQKIGWDDVPEPIRKKVLNWSEKEIQFDDTGLTAPQMQKVKDFFIQQGFKQV